MITFTNTLHDNIIKQQASTNLSLPKNKVIEKGITDYAAQLADEL